MRKVVTETALNKDLAILLPPPVVSADTRLDKPLGAAQRVVGRFFFVHESRALRDGGKEHAFEFLHATFGEFLVARIVVTTLRELVEVRAFNQRRTTPTRLDDSFLWAALSFAALVGSAAIVEFTTGLLRRLPADERLAISDLVTELLRDALYAQPARSFGDYEPVRRRVAARYAAFSCNLAALAVLSADEPIAASDWDTGLWWSQLSVNEWNGLRDTVRIHRRRDPGGWMKPWAEREDDSAVRPYEDISSISKSPTGPLASNHQHFYGFALPAHSEAGAYLRSAAFFGNPLGAPLSMTKILVPYYRYAGDYAVPLSLEQDVLKAPLGNFLLELRLAPFEEHGSDLRLQLYDRCFAIGRDKPGWQSILLRQLREDAPHLEPKKVIELLYKYVKQALADVEVQLILDVLEVLNRPLGDSSEELAELIWTLRATKRVTNRGPEALNRLAALAAALRIGD